MEKAIKTAVIGAGSAVFSLGLVRDFSLTESLAGSTITFMDMDEERLERIHNLARRYATEVKADLRLEKATDRKKALEGADFVINTALVGGHEDQETERTVFEEHGYYRGLHFPYHQLKLMLEVARDMEKLCPDAWLIQSSNPLPEGCSLMTRETNIKVIGLCHGHYGYRDIAKVLGLDLNDVTFQAPGLNHCIWMTHFEYRGEDAYPSIDEWIETKAEKYWKTRVPTFRDNQMSRAAVDIYKMVGLFPIGDTPRAGGWWYHTDLETKKKWYGPVGGFDSEIGWAQYLDYLRERVDHIARVVADPSVSVTKEFPPVKTDEQQVPVIDALVNNNEGRFQVNIPNNGVIPGIPDDVVVEVPAIINNRGVQAMHVGKLPKNLMLHVIIPRILIMERALEAFLTGDKRILLSIFLHDHRTRSVEQAEAAVEALLALPFNRDIAEHFK